MGEWKPISSAPKDGKPILTIEYDPELEAEEPGNLTVVACWRQWQFGGGGYWQVNGARDGDLVTPTHWTELPPPPKD